MPVKRSVDVDMELPSHDDLFHDLKEELIEEWKNPQEFGLPIILEDAILSSKSLRFSVIWNKWEPIPRLARTRIIQDAYAEMRSQAADGLQITLAMGYTVDEAVKVGLLPYKIETLLKPDEIDIWEECRKALEQAGAWQHGDSVELRFASKEDAETVYRKLQSQVPGPYWSMVHEILVGEE